MRTVRFVHASDLHLDATFGGVDAADGKVAGALEHSTLEAFDRVIQLSIDRGVDFLVIAGDLYNSADHSLRAELAFQRGMRRLSDAGIPAFIVRGNHDPADGWSAGLELPDSVAIFPADQVERHEVVRDGEVVCVVYGPSFATQKVTENLAIDFERGANDPYAVAVLHANVGQRQGWDNYAPCSVDDLRAAGMDYWALGHVHVAGRVMDNPPAVYSGSTQGLNPTEEGPRGCFVVHLDEDGAIEEFVETASVRWRRSEIDATDLQTLDDLRTALETVCAGIREENAGLPSIVRLELTGRTSVHFDLGRPGVLADLATDLRQDQLDVDPWIWVDRIRDLTRPALDLDVILAEEGLRGDLSRLARNLSEDSAEVERVIEEVLAPVQFALAARPEINLEANEVVARALDRCLDLLSEEESDVSP
jgi:DNA repair exonuclease SbcCD nuclease subunit